MICLFKGPSPRNLGGGSLPGSPEIGDSHGVQVLLGAESGSAVPLRSSVIFEYGGLIREYAPSLVPSGSAPAGMPARRRLRYRSGPERWIAGGSPLVRSCRLA